MASKCWTEPQHRRGVALLGVLWVLILLSLIALNISATSRIELKLAANLVEGAQRRHATDAGINWSLWSLLQSNTAGWLADGSQRTLEFEDYQVQVAISDESGKIDLNQAHPLLLQGLFLAVGLDQREAESLADAIQDWRDSDDMRRVRGAESAEYLAAGLPEPANRPFERLEELRLVLGMSAELYDQVLPALTLHSRLMQVNPLVAPRLVLLALPGMSEASADQYIDNRRSNYEQGLPPPPFNSLNPSLVASNVPGISYAVETRVSRAGSVTSLQNLIIRRRSGMGSRFEILQQGSPQVSSETGTQPADAGDPL